MPYKKRHTLLMDFLLPIAFLAGFFFLMARITSSKKEWESGERDKTKEALSTGLFLLVLGIILYAVLSL